MSISSAIFTMFPEDASLPMLKNGIQERSLELLLKLCTCIAHAFCPSFNQVCVESTQNKDGEPPYIIDASLQVIVP